MAGNRRLTIEIVGDAKGGIKALDDTSTATDKVGRVLGDLGRLAFGKKLAEQAKAGFDELEEGAKVSAQTAAQLKATGGAAGVTGDHIEELAGQMLKLAGFDDEAAQSAENVLLQFTNIKNSGTDKVFDATTKASADLAVALGTDMPSAAAILGRALDNPANSAKALRAAHITLTEAQKESVAQFTKVGDIASAQAVILDAVNERVGGSAQAFGETLPGKIKIAQESINNARGAMVAGLAPALELGADLATKAAEKFEQLPKGLQETVGVVALVGGGIGAVARPINDVIGLYNKLQDAKKAAAATDAAEVAASNGVIAKLGAVGIALGIGAAAWYGYTHAEQASVDVSKVAGQSTDDLVRAFTGISSVFGHSGYNLDLFTKTAEGSIGTAQRLRDALAAQGDDVSKLDEILHNVASSQQQANADQEAGTGTVKEYGNATDSTAAQVDTLVNSLQDQADALKAQLDPFFGVLDANQRLQKAQEADKKAQDDLTQAIRDYGAESPQAQAAQEALSAAQIDAVQAAAGLDGSLKQLEQSVLSGDTSVAEATGTLRTWVAQGLITQQQADAVTQAFYLTGVEADKLNGRNVEMTVTTHYEETFRAVDAEGHAVQFRASGGPVTAGRPYVVGEDGPETFIPGMSGVIVPNGAGRALAPAALGGGSISLTINVDATPSTDGRAVGRDIAVELEDFLRNGGAIGQHTRQVIRNIAGTG